MQEQSERNEVLQLVTSVEGRALESDQEELEETQGRVAARPAMLDRVGRLGRRLLGKKTQSRRLEFVSGDYDDDDPEANKPLLAI